VLDVVVMLVRDTVLLVKVVDTAPPDTGGLISMVELVVVEEFFEVVRLVGDVLLLVVEVEAESSEPSDASWLVSTIELVVVEEFFEVVRLVEDVLLVVVVVEVEAESP